MEKMYFKREGGLNFNEDEKTIITSIRTSGNFSTDGLVQHTAEMNKRLKKDIHINERKIALGLKRAQGIQTK